LAIYASRGRGIPSAIKFLRKVLDSCVGKPVIVVDRGPWYRWALDRLGITYFHEAFGERNRIERWFREVKDRTKRILQQHKHMECQVKSAAKIAIVRNLTKLTKIQVDVILG
jgi:transposase-like protein